jgi:hypothetical protein
MTRDVKALCELHIRLSGLSIGTTQRIAESREERFQIYREIAPIPTRSFIRLFLDDRILDWITLKSTLGHESSDQNEREHVAIAKTFSGYLEATILLITPSHSKL